MTENSSRPAEDELEAKRKRRFDFKEKVTTKISDIVRFIGLGLIAVFYTIKNGAAYKGFSPAQYLILYIVGISGVISIFLDYIQYNANYYSVDTALKKENLNYEKESFSYRTAEFAFRWKRHVTTFGAAALIVLVLLT
ncbi:hypothetical protein EFV37_21990 [Mesorhizobium loti]|uniref:Uncharacterized protein n=1 Tax=Mesorhizobium jarvisii TaxID=1777867 RepID=A0A6M7TKN5_9HYPH|nr:MULTISPECIES: hypothetical protein [Mesorhizobium]OBQ59605.1 hypothetical protein A9K72_25680 [Mesorhizobium loti]QKC64658.1 hypothetical protein EB229_21985 [Mesorhizobium jarvisii]QKD10572.1 hypothetical protein EFV37_21990 [Mesorhizobium loti]RJT30562.1 hypothetical protein D3242_24620 [Mesorhizobium jarvisii]